MNEDKIKEAFAKAKQDILTLFTQSELIKREIQELKTMLQQTNRQTVNPTQHLIENSRHYSREELENQTENQEKTAFRQIKPTKNMNPTDNPTHNLSLKDFKNPNLNISIGNEGVPTDRQTDQQTDRPQMSSFVRSNQFNLFAIL